MVAIKRWVPMSVLIFIVFLASTPFAQPMKKLKVGYLPFVSQLAYFASLNNGYFKAEGLKIEGTPLWGGPFVIRATVGGSVDVGRAAYYSIFAAREAGIDLVIFAGGTEVLASRPSDGALLVLTDSGIKGAKDLEGKKMAVGSLRGLDRVMISEWMTINGADSNKVVWQEVPYGNMGVALRTKKVDIMITADPFLTVEESQGGVRNIAFVYAEVDPKMPVGGWITTESWLKKGNNRRLIDHLVRGLHKGIDYINTHPEKRGEILTKFTRIKPELASKLRYWSYWNLKIDRQALQRSADLAVKWGLLKKKMDVQDIVLPGVLR